MPVFQPPAPIATNVRLPSEIAYTNQALGPTGFGGLVPAWAGAGKSIADFVSGNMAKPNFGYQDFSSQALAPFRARTLRNIGENVSGAFARRGISNLNNPAAASEESRQARLAQEEFGREDVDQMNQWRTFMGQLATGGGYAYRPPASAGQEPRVTVPGLPQYEPSGLARLGGAITGSIGQGIGRGVGGAIGGVVGPAIGKGVIGLAKGGWNSIFGKSPTDTGTPGPADTSRWYNPSGPNIEPFTGEQPAPGEDVVPFTDQPPLSEFGPPADEGGFAGLAPGNTFAMNPADLQAGLVESGMSSPTLFGEAASAAGLPLGASPDVAATAASELPGAAATATGFSALSPAAQGLADATAGFEASAAGPAAAAASTPFAAILGPLAIANAFGVGPRISAMFQHLHGAGGAPERAKASQWLNEQLAVSGGNLDAAVANLILQHNQWADEGVKALAATDPRSLPDKAGAEDTPFGDWLSVQREQVPGGMGGTQGEIMQALRTRYARPDLAEKFRTALEANTVKHEEALRKFISQRPPRPDLSSERGG